MKMKSIGIDAKSIKERLELNDDRQKVSLYLSRKLYKDFQRACGKAPASRVMEELMQQFIDSDKVHKD